MLLGKAKQLDDSKGGPLSDKTTGNLFGKILKNPAPKGPELDSP